MTCRCAPNARCGKCNEVCIQCNRTTDEIGQGAILLTRPRPLRNGEYQVCFDCAWRIRKEQDARAQAAIALAEKAGA